MGEAAIAEPAPVFRAPISLSCTGLPTGMQCTFSPSTVTPGTAPVAVAVTISCTTQCAKAPHRAGFALQLATFALIAIVALPAKERAGTHVLPFAAMCVLTLCSCGGGSASGGAVTDPTTKTSVTAPVVITATSGAISHSQTVTLIYTK